MAGCVDVNSAYRLGQISKEGVFFKTDQLTKTVLVTLTVYKLNLKFFGQQIVFHVFHTLS